MSETHPQFVVPPKGHVPPAPPPRDYQLGTIWSAAELDPLTGQIRKAPLPIWMTGDNNVLMGDHLLTDADQVLNLVGCLLTALRIMRI